MARHNIGRGSSTNIYFERLQQLLQDPKCPYVIWYTNVVFALVDKPGFAEYFSV